MDRSSLIVLSFIVLMANVTLFFIPILGGHGAISFGGLLGLGLQELVTGHFGPGSFVFFVLTSCYLGWIWSSVVRGFFGFLLGGSGVGVLSVLVITMMSHHKTVFLYLSPILFLLLFPIFFLGADETNRIAGGFKITKRTARYLKFTAVAVVISSNIYLLFSTFYSPGGSDSVMMLIQRGFRDLGSTQTTYSACLSLAIVSYWVAWIGVSLRHGLRGCIWTGVAIGNCIVSWISVFSDNKNDVVGLLLISALLCVVFILATLPQYFEEQSSQNKSRKAVR